MMPAHACTTAQSHGHWECPGDRARSGEACVHSIIRTPLLRRCGLLIGICRPLQAAPLPRGQIAEGGINYERCWYNLSLRRAIEAISGKMVVAAYASKKSIARAAWPLYSV